MQHHIQAILKAAGMPETDPNFQDTPARYERTLKELLSGYSEPAPELKTFPCDEPGDLIFSGPLRASSLCPHHTLPYLIEGYFAYVPVERVVGISKPGRLLQWISARFILQEEIGPKFLSMFQEAVDPQGSAILLKGQHLCSTIRGGKQRDSETITCIFRGCFDTDEKYVDRFFTLVGMR